MSWVPAANLALVVAFFIAGLAISRQVDAGAKLDARPATLQLLVGGVAIAPITFFHEQLGVGPVNGIITAFGVSIALWIVLPALLFRLTGATTAEQQTNCTV